LENEARSGTNVNGCDSISFLIPEAEVEESKKESRKEKALPKKKNNTK
jgi:hypothetical protein